MLTLRVNQVIVEIILSLGFATNQMGYDGLTIEFETVVSTAEEICRIEAEHIFTARDSDQPVFSLTLGIVPAMFFACVRCRYSPIRRRALSVLRTQRRRESIWDTALVASVAEQVVIVEQEAAAHRHDGAGSSSDRESCNVEEAAHTPADLPEAARIKMLAVDFRDSENIAKVSLMSTTGKWERHNVYVWDE